MIDTLHAWLSAVTGAFGSGLMHGTLLAGITALLCVTLLRRARPALIATLWTIVVIKFVLPIGPGMPLSINGMVDATLASETFTAVVEPVSAAGTIQAPIATVKEAAGVSAWFLVQLALLLGYVGIVMTLFARRLRGHLLLLHRLRGLPEAGAALRDQVASVARHMKMRRTPRVKMAGDDTSPFVVGFFRGTLVLPSSLKGDELDAVLWHELAHLRRRDAVIRSLQIIVGTLFFFWPVVAWANRRLDRAREMACDQWAIGSGKLDRKRYARMLVAFARKSTPQAGFAMPMAASHLESRVDALLDRRIAPRLNWMIGLAVAGWALVSLGGSAQASDPAPDEVCLVKVSLADKIIQDFPEADADGDGHISRAEFCSWLRPLADVDNDGRISASEFEGLRSSNASPRHAKLLSSVADPIDISGQVCDACVCEEEVKACMEPDQGAPVSLDPRYSEGE